MPSGFVFSFVFSGEQTPPPINDHPPNGRPSRTANVVGWAISLSSVGFFVALFFAVSSLQGANGPTGVRGTLSNFTAVATASLFGGSIGWFIGAVLGWLPRAVEPTEWGAGRLRATAGLFALIGYASLLAYAVHSALVAFMIGAGAALVSVTLLVLGQQRVSRRSAAVVGATVAIAILATASMQFSSLLPLDRAWLIAWRSGQAEAKTFAPNLLASAPRECAVPTDVGDNHDSLGRSERARPPWLEGHVPRWLPSGFGLLAWSLPPGGTAGVWTDDRCRQIRLVLFEGNPESRRWHRFPVADRVGEWAVLATPCASDYAAEAPCLEYVAWSPGVPGEGEGEVLGLRLRLRGLDRDEGDRFALGIPV
jgi:hypothetical protein